MTAVLLAHLDQDLEILGEKIIHLMSSNFNQHILIFLNMHKHGGKMGEMCKVVCELNLSAIFLSLLSNVSFLCSQADGLCAEVFCQSPVFHLH